MHDIHHSNSGLSNLVSHNLLNILNQKGKVFIFTERKLPESLQKYRLNLDNKNDIFDLIFYADLFISDSQSMTVESAILGTPNIRFNDFVGKISVLEELEKNMANHRYSK